MSIHGSSREIEPSGDFFRGQAIGYQESDLKLPLRELQSPTGNENVAGWEEQSQPWVNGYQVLYATPSSAPAKTVRLNEQRIPVRRLSRRQRIGNPYGPPEPWR